MNPVTRANVAWCALIGILIENTAYTAHNRNQSYGLPMVEKEIWRVYNIYSSNPAVAVELSKQDNNKHEHDDASKHNRFRSYHTGIH